jgi:hypothetical protein
VCDLSELFLVHADAEERRLYPVLRTYLPGGWGEVADQGRRQRAIARTIRPSNGCRNRRATSTTS